MESGGLAEGISLQLILPGALQEFPAHEAAFGGSTGTLPPTLLSGAEFPELLVATTGVVGIL